MRTGKLIADLENPEKIMVFRQNEVVAANDLLDLRSALAAYGPATLLWVQATRPGHPAGSVVVVDDTLMVGYVSRLALRENQPDLDLRSWLTMLRAAHAARGHAARGHAARGDASRDAARRQALPVARSGVPEISSGVMQGAELPRRTDVVFGRGGNARALTGDGWSMPEDGYTWAIEDRSTLTIAKPAVAARYRLEMEVVPFVAPPALAAQTLGISVNGETIHTFDPLPRGPVGCAVPGRLLERQDTIQIALEHPAAASPRMVAGENDDRRLAVAFYRVSLICDQSA